jgi:hypothetical protein
VLALPDVLVEAMLTLEAWGRLAYGSERRSMAVGGLPSRVVGFRRGSGCLMVQLLLRQEGWPFAFPTKT